jgi:hypothetical protein
MIPPSRRSFANSWAGRSLTFARLAVSGLPVEFRSCRRAEGCLRPLAGAELDKHLDARPRSLPEPLDAGHP